MLKVDVQDYRSTSYDVYNFSDGTFEELKVGDGRVRFFDLKTKYQER